MRQRRDGWGTRQFKSKVKTNVHNNFRISLESHLTPKLKSEVKAKFKNDVRPYTSGRARYIGPREDRSYWRDAPLLRDGVCPGFLPGVPCLCIANSVMVWLF
jgi:hypothetical protein